MKDQLVDFLQELSKNPEMKEKYLKAPKDVAKEYGLSDEDVEVLLSKDEAKLKQRIKEFNKIKYPNDNSKRIIIASLKGTVTTAP